MINQHYECHKWIVWSTKNEMSEGIKLVYKSLNEREYGKDLLRWLALTQELSRTFKSKCTIKVYFDAGLSDLAKVSGYQLLGSIDFLLEAFYRYFLDRFLGLDEHLLADILDKYATGIYGGAGSVEQNLEILETVSNWRLHMFKKNWHLYLQLSTGQTTPSPQHIYISWVD